MASYIAEAGEFTRDTKYIETRITADGRDGYPVQPDRYRLVVARACPWANRAMIVRRLLGLESVLSNGFRGRTHGKQPAGNSISIRRRRPAAEDPCPQDAYSHVFRTIRKASPSRRSSTCRPERWSPMTTRMTLDLSTQWTAYHRDGAPQLYPEALRDEIDDVGKRVYTEINNGVYRCGFAGSQQAYDAAYDRLFTALDWVSDRLENQRYLVGETITEADVRLFTTLARFDPVYHGHFKCNRSKLTEMPVLWAYAETCSRRWVLATPSTSSRSSSTTTSCMPTSPDADRAEGSGAGELVDTA